MKEPICPFCLQPLQIRYRFGPKEYFSHYAFCRTEWCLSDEISRFSYNFEEDINSPTSIAVVIDKWYVQISYKENTTTISILDSYILLDPVMLPRSFVFNPDRPEETLRKIKTMVIFS
jgi:hypothetical protein